jgi:uncharacterized protein (TIGR02246 family)
MGSSAAVRLTAFATVLLMALFNTSAQTLQLESLSTSDISSIKAVLQRYRAGWLANDPDAVRSAFTKDAVLMPHHGVAPVVGIAAINEFWWPASSTTTTITKFEQAVDETDGSGKVAYVRGRSEVEWSVEDQGRTQHWRNHGNFMAIFKKQPDDRWLISHLIWDDPPNELR